jgi:hypothetical protein
LRPKLAPGRSVGNGAEFWVPFTFHSMRLEAEIKADGEFLGDSYLNESVESPILIKDR